MAKNGILTKKAKIKLLSAHYDLIDFERKLKILFLVIPGTLDLIKLGGYRYLNQSHLNIFVSFFLSTTPLKLSSFTGESNNVFNKLQRLIKSGYVFKNSSAHYSLTPKGREVLDLIISTLKTQLMDEAF